MSTIRVQHGDMPATIRDNTSGRGAVIIVPSIFGIGDDLVEQMEEMAGKATKVVAIDSFFRVDPGVIPFAEFQRARERMSKLDLAQAYNDAKAAIAVAREAAPDGPVVMVGICFGGPFAFKAAADGLVDGVVTWHGSRLDQFVEDAAKMSCPMQLHFGDSDPVVPMETVEAVRKVFAARNNVQVFLHPGATHGFSHRSAGPSYNAAAEQAGMTSVIELLG